MQYEKGIIPLIELHYDNFTETEKNIAKFFLHNEKEIDFSAQNVASLIYTSEASLSRFAKKCGFKGYRQFIYQYQDSFQQNNDRNVTEGTQHILNTYQELLNKSYALIDEQQIKRIAKMIGVKRRVFVYGKGSSGIAGEELKLRFMRLGIDIECITDSHVMTMNSAIVGMDSMVIGITVSGRTEEVIHSVKTAKKQGAATILISSTHKSGWNEFCDEVIPIPTKENLDLGKLISPQFPILVLFDVLYTNVLQFEKSGKEALYELTLAELNALAPSGKII